MVNHFGVPKEHLGAKACDINISSDEMRKMNLWARKPHGNLILHGETGRGKSYAAVACMYYLDAMHKIPLFDQKFINVSDLYQEWLLNQDDKAKNYDLLQKLKEIRVLILDDVGVRSPSEGFLEYIYNIINHRCGDKDLISIYTMNLTSLELTNSFGPRITSRMSDGVFIKFDKNDARTARKTANGDRVVV